MTARLLRRWPLPQPDEAGDKEERGRVLVVGGGPEMPGAAILAGTAALRAGAGKLRIATAQSVAPLVGVALPESRVFGLPETESGAIARSAADRIIGLANGVDAVVFGPGMVDEEAVTTLLAEVLPRLHGPAAVLDAAALACVSADPRALHGLGGRAILTPHAAEMARLLGKEKASVMHDPPGTALRAAAALRATVVLKGAETVIATPGGGMYRNRTGNVGLATSGSGDTLSGIVAGLAARGASPEQAAVWAVFLHGRAGDALAERIGRLGFLARELLAEVPALLCRLEPPKARRA